MNPGATECPGSIPCIQTVVARMEWKLLTCLIINMINTIILRLNVQNECVSVDDTHKVPGFTFLGSCDSWDMSK